MAGSRTCVASSATRSATLDNLAIEDGPPLVPGPGQVVVDVQRGRVNFVDALIVRGAYQIKPPTPFTPGSEVAGVVVGVGDGCRWRLRRRSRDRVVRPRWIRRAGRCRRSIGLSAPRRHRVRARRGPVQSYATALVRAHSPDDDHAGGVGARPGSRWRRRSRVRRRGAMPRWHVPSASRRAKTSAGSRSDAGAEAAIDPGTEDVKVRARELSGGGVDVVVDAIGGELAEPALRALRTDAGATWSSGSPPVRSPGSRSTRCCSTTGRSSASSGARG